jgi:hypothetical protein
MLAAEGADATGYPKRTRSVFHIAGEGEQRASGAARGDGRAERVMAAGEWRVGGEKQPRSQDELSICASSVVGRGGRRR